LAGICAVIVFVMPYGYHVDLGPGPNGLMAILWEYPEEIGFLPLSALEYFIYYLYRLIVLRAVWRFMSSKMTVRRMMSHAALAELIPVLISVPGMLFLNAEGENYIPIMIPIPLLLLFCVILLELRRRHQKDVQHLG
jgi:hypothetical protein